MYILYIIVLKIKLITNLHALSVAIHVLSNRVRKDYTSLHVYLGGVWVVICVKYITYEGLLHNTLELDVDTVQEACVQQTRV